MLHESDTYCPFCDSGFDDDARNFARGPRRRFLRTVGGGAAALFATNNLAMAADDLPAKPANQVAENLVGELYATLSAEQKKAVVRPWDHRKGNLPARLGTYNSAIEGKRIRDHYTKAQQELIQRTLRAILSSDEAYERISRNNRWDSSGSFDGCGATIFGEPGTEKPFAWVFSGHHLTLRCDGNSQPGAAFGGPIYYGHRKPGYSKENVYFYQTEQVQGVFESLDAEQRKVAVAEKNPGDGRRGIQFRADGDAPRPGISYDDLSAEQQGQVDGVLRTLLAPFRQEDTDEVMSIVKAHGGTRTINLAFYKDKRSSEDSVRWHFWRLEGPGFIWNYRPLPHVHCFANIADRSARAA